MFSNTHNILTYWFLKVQNFFLSYYFRLEISLCNIVDLKIPEYIYRLLEACKTYNVNSKF